MSLWCAVALAYGVTPIVTIPWCCGGSWGARLATGSERHIVPDARSRSTNTTRAALWWGFWIPVLGARLRERGGYFSETGKSCARLRIGVAICLRWRGGVGWGSLVGRRGVGIGVKVGTRTRLSG